MCVFRQDVPSLSIRQSQIFADPGKLR